MKNSKHVLLLMLASFQMGICQQLLAAPLPGGGVYPVESIDPFIGTLGVGHGSCMPGPCLPHSSIYPSPDSDTEKAPSGYLTKGKIVGFSQLHTQGTGGTPSFGNILISPQIGLQIAEKSHASPKTDEVAKAYSYSVTLSQYNIKCEVVPSEHCALYKFTFPASTDSHIVIDAARKIGSSKSLVDGSVTVDGATGTIYGGGSYDGNWTPGSYKLFFTAIVSKKPESFGTWKGDKQNPQEAHTDIAKTPGGAFVGFSTGGGEVVYMKVGLSFKSPEQSAAWLKQEIPDWDLDKLKATAIAKWKDELSPVTVTGGDPDEVGRFYTGLFHTMVQPRNRTNDLWDNADPFWDDHYTLWDSWRTVYPLLGLTDAKAFGDIVNSFIARHKRNGYVPEAVVGGLDYKAGQGGNEVDNVITEAYFDQIPGVDWAAAHAVQVFNAEQMRTEGYRNKGYTSIEEPKKPYASRMHSGGATIEFAYDDFCVAELSKALGNQAEYNKYLQRSHNWEQVWNDALTEGEFSGFPNSRHQDGAFSGVSPRKGYNTDFYEGTCWIYSYRPTYDILGLIAKMGGRETFTKRLIYALRNGLIDFTNEPSFQTIWLLDAVNRPYLASYWSNFLRTKYSGLDMPGDEDNGAMSSLYCFLDLGIFPFAGQDLYYLHGGLLPQVSFHLNNGKTFTIIDHNAGPKNIYVQSAALKGAPLSDPFIHHADILNGGTLEFVMGPEPSAWGCAGEFNAATAAEETK